MIVGLNEDDFDRRSQGSEMSFENDPGLVDEVKFDRNGVEFIDTTRRTAPVKLQLA